MLCGSSLFASEVLFVVIFLLTKRIWRLFRGQVKSLFTRVLVDRLTSMISGAVLARMAGKYFRR